MLQETENRISLMNILKRSGPTKWHGGTSIYTGILIVKYQSEFIAYEDNFTRDTRIPTWDSRA